MAVARRLSVQSMTKTDTADVSATVAQIEEMVRAGCEVVRLAVPDNDAAIALKEIRKRVPDVPLVADIHFHYKLALLALEAGIDKLRLNPGNIGKHERIVEVVRAAQAQKVPIRIGVNGGSLEKDLLKKYGTATPEAMVESAMRHIQILEDLGFTDTIISLKASDVHRTVAAYRLLAEKVDYPFHLGVTEAGTAFGGTIKSSIGLGILLHEGIGDTIRVSLAAEPQEEVRVAWEIVKSLGLRTRGVTVVAPAALQFNHATAQPALVCHFLGSLTSWTASNSLPDQEWWPRQTSAVGERDLRPPATNHRAHRQPGSH